MSEFDEQGERIKNKLAEAKQIDAQLKVFGANHHKYIIGKPISVDEVARFEDQMNISLPDCYKFFLTHIGNSGQSFAKSAAGPYYGIYPFRNGLNELCLEKYLSADCKLYPFMTDSYWSELKETLELEDSNDEDYEVERGKIYAGVLPIGDQGCGSYHCLVLNGEYKGKVVNCTFDMYKPKFTYEENFLDWYERWLDEVISGQLIINQPSWFGYTIGGNDTTIMETYFSTDNEEIKKDCLSALLTKVQIEDATVDCIVKEFKKADSTTKIICLYIITKFDYERAKPYLLEYVPIDLLTVYQSLLWYAKDKIDDWQDVLNRYKEGDEKTLQFRGYLLEILKKKQEKRIQIAMPQINEMKNKIISVLKKKWDEIWKN